MLENDGFVLGKSVPRYCVGNFQPPGSLFSGENGRCHVASFFGLCGNTKTLGHSVVQALQALFTGFTGSIYRLYRLYLQAL
jgi:hypothetical protein